VRFLFILLGPGNADLDYHEIGRSISTLMSNAVSDIDICLSFIVNLLKLLSQ